MRGNATSNACQVPRCRREADFGFIGKRVCSPCWHKYMSEKYPNSNELRRRLSLPLLEVNS